MTAERLKLLDNLNVGMVAQGQLKDEVEVRGFYDIICRDSLGVEIWREAFANLVVTSGKNALESIGLGASGTAGNAFMGMIGGTVAPTIVAGDVMTSHAGWLEAGNANPPLLTGTRASMTFGAPSGGTIISTGNTFIANGSGTLTGAFVNFSNGATNTFDNTAGTLFSAGAFSAAQPVIATNTLTVGFTLTM